MPFRGGAAPRTLARVTTDSTAATPTQDPSTARPAAHGLAARVRLAGPASLVSRITPNWFASVMGTGIVANAAAALPVHAPWLTAAAEVVWLAASAWLVVLVVASAAHWALHPASARGHHTHPVMAHFYGAPPMALLTVGAGAVAFGPAVVGGAAATATAWTLWAVGTVLGLAAAAAIPVLLFTRIPASDDHAFGGWLMPVVPPMVSAATGAALVPTLPAGEPREAMLLACYLLFGVTLVPAMLILAQLWSRLARHKVGAAGMVPTLWIVLGPVGQSITAANLLGVQAHRVLPEPFGTALQAAGVVYGVPMLGFALLWMLVAGAITVRTARTGMPFALTWWSFTFPVGTCVTGAAALAAQTGAPAFGVLSVLLYVGLVAAWAAVAVRTAHGAFVTGDLLLGPSGSAAGTR